MVKISDSDESEALATQPFIIAVKSKPTKHFSVVGGNDLDRRYPLNCSFSMGKPSCISKYIDYIMVEIAC